MVFKIKRAYDKFGRGDGYKVLVDRLWMRGISKEDAPQNKWMKDIAPSTELRKWYNHDETKWPEFKKRYLKELRANKEDVNELLELGRKHNTVTLIYSSKSPKNNAVVLCDYLNKKLNKK